MKRFGVFVVLLMLVGLCFPTIAVSSFETNQEEYRPGSSGSITLTVNNPDDYDITGISITIFNPTEILPSAFTTISDLPSGSTVAMTVPFRVKQDASAGIYLLTLRFSGFSEDPNVERIRQSSVSVPITVLEAPVISISMDDPTELSGLTNATLVFTNDGGPARRAKLSISADEEIPVALYGTSKVSLGDIIDRVEAHVMLDSRNVEDGPVDVPFLLEYDDELGNPQQEMAYLRTTVENEILDIFFVQNSNIVTREESDLLLDVVNRGDEDLSDVRISFLNDSIRLKEGQEIKVGDVSADGGRTSVSERIFCELPPGLISVPARVTWVEEGVRKEQEIDIPLTILSDADVGVYLEAKPAPLMSGMEHTISVLVSNLGSYRISNVEVELSSDAFTNVDISNTQYLGGLDADDFSTVQFKVKVTAPPDDEYPVTVKVRYRDQSGEWVTRTLTNMLVVSGVQAEGLPNGYLLIAVILVVVAVWFFFLRKRKG